MFGHRRLIGPVLAGLRDSSLASRPRARAVVALLPAVFLLGAAPAPDEHAAHHPAPGPPQPGMGATSPAGARSGPGEMGGMMAPSTSARADGCCGGDTSADPIYAELMALPALTAEQRGEIEALAARQIEEGLAVLAEGSEALRQATAADDPARMHEASVRMRDGLARLEAGVAARRVLVEGKAPRNLALEWFRTQMNLATPAPAPSPPRILGVSPIHLLTMGLLVGVAFAMVAAYVARMRRAAALLGSLAREGVDAGVPPAVPRPDGGAGEGAASPGGPAAAPALVAPGQVLLRPAVGAWKGRLRVAAITPETAVVKTFRLMMLDDSPMAFTFAPGQYVNVTAPVGDAPQTRAYTIASSPTQRDYIELTVKREERGAMSRHLHDAVKVGDELDIAGPNGSFVFTGQEADSIVLVAGGVGITPMMSIIRFLCDRSWSGSIFLVYACRSSADFVFAQELAALERRNAGLQVVATMARTEGTDWMGPRGFITKDLLVQSVPEIATRRIHVCGPPPMMESIKAILAELGVPREHIKTEAFGPPLPRDSTTVAAVVAPPSVAAAGGTARLVTFARSNKIARIQPGRTVLELADEIGVDIDNQCRVGTCGRCKVKLAAGEVTMEVQDALDDTDRKDGIILACQAKPTTDIAVEA